MGPSTCVSGIRSQLCWCAVGANLRIHLEQKVQLLNRIFKSVPIRHPDVDATMSHGELDVMRPVVLFLLSQDAAGTRIIGGLSSTSSTREQQK